LSISVELEKMSETKPDYDALMIVSFGGPEGMGDVIPFLNNVLRGKNVSEARKLEVARHYKIFQGVSPINGHNRELKRLLETEIAKRGLDLPVYWGNRNWKPMLDDTLAEMKKNGIQNALGYFTSAYSSYSGCRQYRENIEAARKIVGQGAPEVHKLRAFYDHPLFIESVIERIRNTFSGAFDSQKVSLVFTAHSIPVEMAKTSKYVEQLQEACALVAGELGTENWQLAYQSRSGPPHVPWLEPDICDCLEKLKAKGIEDVVVSPIGFVSDHMEVLFDLDVEAKEKAQDLGLVFHRAPTPGCDERIVHMILELVSERREGAEKRVLGKYGPVPDICPPDCCRYTQTGPTPTK
jgi:ferrochelatase